MRKKNDNSILLKKRTKRIVNVEGSLHHQEQPIARFEIEEKQHIQPVRKMKTYSLY